MRLTKRWGDDIEYPTQAQLLEAIEEVEKIKQLWAVLEDENRWYVAVFFDAWVFLAILKLKKNIFSRECHAKKCLHCGTP